MSTKQRGTLERNTTTITQNQLLYLPLNSEFFVPLPIPIVERRDKIAEELLKTEQSYLKSLTILIEVFKKPMTERMKELGLNEDHMKVIFGNLEELININTTLLKSLFERMKTWSDKTQIGDVLQQLVPFLKLYSLYSYNFEKANGLLAELCEKKSALLKVWLDKTAEDPICQGLDFNAYLITPIQRLPRYRLLLEELVKNTSQMHPDFTLLNSALNTLKIVADDVNKSINERENREKMLQISKKFYDYKDNGLIQPGRSFIKDGDLYKVCRKDRKKRHFFLFSDILVYAFPLGVNQTKFRISMQFSLIALAVRNIPDAQSKNLSNSFELQSGAKSFIVIAESSKAKEEWLKVLKEAITELKKNKATLHSSGIDEAVPVAPVWVPDHEVKKCVVCQTKFTITNRRHHCRQCGMVVCSDCSANKRRLGVQGRVRVCDECLKKPEDCQSGVGVDVSDSSEDDENVDPIFSTVALYNYNPQPNPQSKTKKLPFKKGDYLNILKTDESGWWLAEHQGEGGWVPSTYLQQNAPQIATN